MPVVTVDEFTFDRFGSEFLILITAAITNSRFTPKRNYLEIIAFPAFVKIKAFTDFAAVNNLSDFNINNVAHRMNLNKFIPFVLKNPLQADHTIIVPN